MERLLIQGATYHFHEYELESEFERAVASLYHDIFGEKTIYVDIKKRIGDSILSIPDGYLIDFTFEKEPRLYIIENELSSHDPYKHIGAQLLKFAIGYRTSGRKIKEYLLEYISQRPADLEKVNNAVKNSNFRNSDALLEWLIFDKPVAAIVIIDRSSSDLENVLSQLTLETDIIEFQSFTNGKEFIHKFEPFNQEVREIEEKPQSTFAVEDLDTIVVPARADGFQEVFIEENCWYSIRISAAMLDRIKYIAAYQVAPVSAITHYAEVSKIEKYRDTNKYILYFKEPAKEIKPIHLGENSRGKAPQAPRYTTFKKLSDAKILSDVF